mgnify:CR=1 FL=1
MSAIQPPEARVWWKQPIEPLEITWIAVAFIWCLFMFLMMPYWHFRGRQNSRGEAYAVRPMDFLARTERSVAAGKDGSRATTPATAVASRWTV